MPAAAIVYSSVYKQPFEYSKIISHHANA